VQRIFTGSWGGWVTARSLDGTREFHRFLAHKDRIAGMEVSNDGKLLATASRDNTVKLWDTSTWRELRQLPGAGEVPYGLALSPHGKRVAIASDIIHVYSAADGKQLAELDTVAKYVNGIKFTVDGARLLSFAGPNSEEARLWDVETGKVLRTFVGHRV